MLNFWTHWVEAVRFTFEAQSVISLRLLLLASGGPGSADEMVLMMSEKFDVFANAEIAATQALADGCGIIPSPIDQNPCAHWRNPMDIIRHG
jgi:hypothetical protein